MVLIIIFEPVSSFLPDTLYIVQKGMLTDMSVLQEAPFTDKGSIVEVFDDLSVWMGIKRVIDSINGNAKAS